MNHNYFAEPLNKHTNDRIFELIKELSEQSEAAYLRCADGEERNLIGLTDRALMTAVADVAECNLSFNTFQKTEEGIVPISVMLNGLMNSDFPASQVAKLSPEEIRRALRIVKVGGRWKRKKLAKSKNSRRRSKPRTLPVGVMPHNARRRPGPKPKKRNALGSAPELGLWVDRHIPKS